MRHIIASGAVAFALLLSCPETPAFAMPGAGNGMPSVRASDPAERFDSMDADHDGKLTWEELSAARPNLSRNAFDIIDSSRDGHIDLEEWKAFSAGHGGSVSMPPMEDMMKAMRGAGDAASAKTGNGMPLVMPPAGSSSAEKGAPSSGQVPAMPLITPPSEGK